MHYKKDNFGFSLALEFMATGKAVKRKGWEGKFIYLVKGRTVPAFDLRNEAANHHPSKQNEPVKIHNHLDMKNPDNSITVGWAANQEEMLAEDWMIA